MAQVFGYYGGMPDPPPPHHFTSVFYEINTLDRDFCSTILFPIASNNHIEIQ